MSPADYGRFLEAVAEHLTNQGLAFQIDDGWVTIDGREGQLGLENLAKSCSNADRNEWPTVISKHFQIMLVAQPNSDDIALDFNKAQALLKVRVWPVDYAKPGLLVLRTLDQTLIEALVYDLPDTVVNVKPEHVANWAMAEDDLFQIAERNTSNLGLPEGSPYRLPDGTEVTVFENADVFTSTHSLWLDRLLTLDGTRGAVISLPNRHVLVAHPFDDLSIVTAISGMIPLANHLFQRGPGSISPSLYWWREGRFVRLPSEFDGKTVSFYPPDEFVVVLNQLGPAPA
ncbi:MAG: hypothetical protein QOE92_602 [Chloroflexota bacterium]|jgi:hypothetical protein|nr:hypothetical protein [Chloroflexota bacterium]